jgi:hypothetical protein
VVEQGGDPACVERVMAAIAGNARCHIETR